MKGWPRSASLLEGCLSESFHLEFEFLPLFPTVDIYNSIIGAMDIELDRDRIVTRFKRAGHQLNRNCLELITSELRNTSNPSKKLDEILKKVD